jgi:hypothetical protein
MHSTRYSDDVAPLPPKKQTNNNNKKQTTNKQTNKQKNTNKKTKNKNKNKNDALYNRMYGYTKLTHRCPQPRGDCAIEVLWRELLDSIGAQCCGKRGVKLCQSAGERIRRSRDIVAHCSLCECIQVLLAVIVHSSFYDQPLQGAGQNDTIAIFVMSRSCWMNGAHTIRCRANAFSFFFLMPFPSLPCFFSINRACGQYSPKTRIVSLGNVTLGLVAAILL